MSGELTDRLQLVRPLNIDQIPLIGVIAESPFWGFGLRQFGFNYPEVKRNLLVRYQAKILIEGCNTPKLKSYMVNRNERFVRKDMDTVQENSVQSPIFSDSNRDALFLQCLANEEIKHLVNDWHQLTPENYNENSGRLVQHALNLISIRKGNLQDCRYTATKGGLHVYKYADRLFYSFCREKAFAEMLICILADMYSNTQIQPTETTLSLNNFLSGSGISRLVDAQIERLMKCSSNIFLHYASRRIWGNTVYFGKLSGVTI